MSGSGEAAAPSRADAVGRAGATGRSEVDVDDLVRSARAGDRRSLARLLSVVERGGEPARQAGRLVHPLGGHAYTVGITGAPGAGKSTLTNGLIGAMRVGGPTAVGDDVGDAAGDDVATGEEVAVLAVDPSSPFTGGAILGDRVRMGDHALDPGVFIRSMATRGHLGGLSLATPQAVRVLDAAGFPWIVVETVGVGQVEVEIAGAADTTVVVVNPGWGDAIQANKAGLMEIADVFVINKADRPGADDTRRDLEQMLDLTATQAWRPPIVPTVATSGEGIPELWAAIRAHRADQEERDVLAPRRLARLEAEIERIVVERLREQARERRGTVDTDALHAAVADRSLDPWSAADRLLAID